MKKTSPIERRAELPWTKDPLLWCSECGRMMPWKHEPSPTLRARVANKIVNVLQALVERAERWRDAPGDR